MALKVFLSYAREDREIVEDLYARLLGERFDPWMDVKKLLPGQNWEVEIDLALRAAHVVIACLSNKSVSKRGFVQREANFAIDNLKYKLPTDIYFIPILLEPCEVPTHFGIRQFIDINTPNAWEQLVASLKLAASQQSISVEQGSLFGPYNVVLRTISERRDGSPGHVIEIDYPHFTSLITTNEASELSLLFEGRAKAKLIENRSDPGSQDEELSPFPSAEISLNGYWESVNLAYANNAIVSIVIGVSWYGAGAAHPNHHFETFNFTTVDGLRQFQLSSIFSDPHAAEMKLADLCIAEISREYWKRVGEYPDDDAARWIAEGCKPNAGNFIHFSVSNEGITIYFPPYQVAAYSFGRFDIFVSFFDLLPLVRRDGIYSLIRGS